MYGDIIRTRNLTTKITGVEIHKRSSIYKIGDLKITNDHPIWIDDKWVLPKEIKGAEKIEGDIETYYIETDTGHFDVYDGSETWNVSGNYNS